jgi:hypothetical protein
MERAGLLNGSGDSATVNAASTRQLRQEAGIAAGLSTEPGGGKVDVYELAAASILAARPTGPSYRRPGSAGLAVSDADPMAALEELVDRAMAEPEARDAADLLTNGRRRNGDAIGPLSDSERSRHEALVKNALRAARFGRASTLSARRKLGRLARTLSNTIAAAGRPTPALVNELEGLLAVVKG